MTPIRVALAGADGRMGRVVGAGLEAAEGIALVALIEVGDDYVEAVRSSKANVVVDFTTPEVAVSNARKILEAGAHGVIGTTGFTEQDLEGLDVKARAAKRALLIAPNFAIGAILAQRFAAEASKHFPRAEIVEYHHDGKKDAPSGTALRTAEKMGRARRPEVPPAPPAGPADDPARGVLHEGVRIHSVRLPGLVAHQDVVFGGAGELLTIRHDALSRECYVPGILLGIRTVQKKVGVLRGLESIFGP